MSNERTLPSPWYSWIRARQLEGTLADGPSVGCWDINCLRVLRGWGQPWDEDFPFDPNGPWPPAEPANADELAKPQRIWCYQRVRNSVDCRLALDKFGAAAASFDITDQWFNAARGEISYPASGDEVGGHCVCIDAYKEHISQFRFANSWGTGWGDQGYGYMAFDFFDEYLTDAWVGIPYGKPSLQCHAGINKLSWGQRGFGNCVIHGIEVYDYTDDTRIGWTFSVERDGYLNVEELFVRPEHRGNGHGTNMWKLIGELSDKLRLAIVVWISHADSCADNLRVVDHLCAKSGLLRKPSGVRWASYKADCLPLSAVIPPVPPVRSRPRLFQQFRYLPANH
jgi:GNAT superfamily N-acetyltransferase